MPQRPAKKVPEFSLMERVHSQPLTAGRHIRAFRLMEKPQEGQVSCINYSRTWLFLMPCNRVLHQGRVLKMPFPSLPKPSLDV